MTDNPSTPETEQLDEAMRGLREAVRGQLGVERPAHAAVAREDCERFSDDLPDTLAEERRRALVERAEELQPWLQGPFWLGGDLVIGGQWRNDQRWIGLRDLVPNVHGRRVLDVGANAGYDPFMFKRLGAAEVVALEPFEFIEQARFLESIYRTGVRFEQAGWESLDPERHGRFELVHCHGVLYHELHPMAMLHKLRAVLADGGTLLFGSMMLGDPELSEYARFVPGAYYGDPTWWWVPGRLCMRWMLEAAGFDHVEEFGVSEGPPGEFHVVNGYLRATAEPPG